MTQDVAAGAFVLASIGGVLFLIGLAIAMFGGRLPSRGGVAAALMLSGGLLVLILVIETAGDAPPLPPAPQGPFPTEVPGDDG